MGDGLDRAGYKQVSGCVDAILIGPSTGSTRWTSGSWAEIEVISSKAIFAGVVAPGLQNSSKITSGTTFLKGARLRCNEFTRIKLSSKSTKNAVIAFKKVIL